MIHISKGNSKVGKIPNISLIPVRDCGNCSACKDKCYALKAWVQYPGVRKAWGDNSEAFREFPLASCAEAYTYIKKHNVPYFRIHVAGDFLNQRHLDSWGIIGFLTPDTQYMVNTKMFDLDYTLLPKNIHVRFSMWPGQPIPESTLPKAWLDDGTDTRIPQDAIECSGYCDSCLECYLGDKDVVFKLH